jgi:hypothetical protein
MAFFGFTMGEAAVLWRPLIIFVIGVAIYSIFVYKFYRFLAKRKIMKLKLSEYEMHPTLKKLVHGLEVIFLFPFIAFFWFFVMSLLITLISTEQNIETILYISVAFVSAVRIAAYYNEDLAKDLAKLVPFALLAIFIIDASFLSWDGTLALIGQLFTMWKTLAYYLVFVILLELVLRIITIRRHGKKDSGKASKEKADADEKKMKGSEEASVELDKMLEKK